MPVLLIAAASPDDQDRLSLGRELKTIKQSLERSRNREQWRIETIEAATVDDLRRGLLDHRPTVVHFCGHGGGPAGLCFEDDQGLTHLTQAGPLTRLFHHFKDTLKCVVLNACHSDEQAEAIIQQIDYVIGMRSSIRDDAAEKFSMALYDAVFAGADFRLAFDIASTSIDLHNLPGTDVPVFRTSPQLGGISLAFTEDIPEIENVLLAYLNAPYTERYQFTTKGESIREAMRSYYGDDRMQSVLTKVTVLAKRRLDAEHWKVRCRVESHRDAAVATYYLRIRDRDIRVEWEASAGYWSMPVKTYLALGTAEQIVARVTAELGNNYYDYASGEAARRFQNVTLETIDGERLWGYVRRTNNAVYGPLMEILADGNPHDITLGIVNVDDSTQSPLIQALLSRTWIVPESQPISDSGHATQ